jgi:hypothetical protein
MSLFTRLLEADKASLRIPPRASMIMSTDSPNWCSFPELNDNKFIKNFNATHPDNPIVVNGYLGSGTEGIVFKTKNGVIKVTGDASEHKLASTLEKLHKLKSLPAAYQNIKTGQMAHNGHIINTIEKEDLHSLHTEHPVVKTSSNVMERIAQLHHVMHDGLPREVIHGKIISWKNRALRSPDIPDDEKKHLKNFAHGLHRMVRFGIVPGDLGVANFGRRSDGSFAIRDLGSYHVIDDIPKISKSSPLPAKNVSKATDKYRSIRKQS